MIIIIEMKVTYLVRVMTAKINFGIYSIVEFQIYLNQTQSE